jgi:DNA-binding NtrC family response regulator
MTPSGRILVVDDTRYVRDILRDYLTDLGYEVLLAEDGTSALAISATTRVDLVLLDLRLPDMTGETVFVRLRSAAPRLPIVILSANSDTKRAQELMQLGAFDYVPKPWDFDYLDRVVVAAIAGPDAKTGSA